MKRIDADGHLSNRFQDGDPGSGIKGTQVDAAWLNNVQEELAGVVEAASITLDGDDDGQLLQALAGFFNGSLFMATDSGVADAYVLTAVGAAPLALFDGLRVKFRPDNNNTGACTANFAGLGAKTISNASTGFIKAGNMTELEYNSATDEFSIVNTAVYFSAGTGFSISDGMITQFGEYVSDNDNKFAVSFPIAFPSEVIGVRHSGTADDTGVNGAVTISEAQTLTLSGFSSDRPDALDGSFTIRYEATGL